MTWASMLCDNRYTSDSHLATDGNGVRRGCLGLAGLAVILVVLSGCGASVGNVSGKVIYQGKPLPSGQITFFCEGGDKPVITRPIRNGMYSIGRAPTGKARVAIFTFQSKYTPPPAGLKSLTPTNGSPAPSGPYVPIPARYRMPDTSGLAVTIVSGKQTQDWELHK